MSAPIDFYFDFSSPYGYLAAQRIDGLAARHGRTVDWHPVLLGVIFKETGAQPLTQVPLKGDYSRRDMPRSARFLGIEDFRMPSRFPIPTQAAARIVLGAQGEERCVIDQCREGAVPRVLLRGSSTSPTRTSRPTSPDARAPMRPRCAQRSTTRPSRRRSGKKWRER